MQRGDIRDWEDALGSRCNWGWLRGCWGATNISPADIDFWVQRGRYHLIGEIKRRREDITQGQTILLSALDRWSTTTVFFLIGDIEDHEIWPTELMVLPGRLWRPCDRASFYKFCSGWYSHVERINVLAR